MHNIWIYWTETPSQQNTHLAYTPRPLLSANGQRIPLRHEAGSCAGCSFPKIIENLIRCGCENEFINDDKYKIKSCYIGWTLFFDQVGKQDATIKGIVMWHHGSIFAAFWSRSCAVSTVLGGHGTGAWDRWETQIGCEWSSGFVRARRDH